MSTHKLPKTLATSALTLILSAVLAGNAQAITATQAKRIHDRLVGTPPSANCLNQLIPKSAADAAIDVLNNTNATATDHCTGKDFYRVTLKNFITPWTNEEQTVFAPLNDYTATLIGIIRDELDFRRALYDDILYTGPGASGLANSNAHYKALEDTGADLQAVLTASTQSTHYPTVAPAGIFTTRAGAKAFFVDGTNRAMFRFTMMNHLCNDMEQVKDTSYPPDRIQQDVSRSPGGDSRIFMNACIGCHNGMDPMNQAFAYYNWNKDPDGNPNTDDGLLEYTDGVVQPKYLINANNFEYGYATSNNGWNNYWRTGTNSALGWDTNNDGIASSGMGAASMGMELAHSEAFARCQVEKVFKAVCLRTPLEAADIAQIDTMTSTFKGNGFNLKQIFADSAVFCAGS